MNANSNPVEAIINNEAKSRDSDQIITGPIAELVGRYGVDGEHLLGFLLDMTYDEIQIVTCDNWKQRCGGVPRNSLVLVKLSPRVINGQDHFSHLVILARITDAIPTPVKQEIQQTLFQIHKVQAVVDPFTDVELQWGALKATILGTYYDHKNDEGELEVAFGNDVDSFYSPHFYEAYIPTDEDLQMLVNLFVADKSPVIIGQLRYTETQFQSGMPKVFIQISADDFIGNRTALFGKTRMGKSNTIKVIADTILLSGKKVGQVIFDPSGEYSYWNEQDQTSLYILHRNKCTRYSLKPRQPDQENDLKLPEPKRLRANFYNQIELGHSLILGLYDTVHTTRPDYIAPLLAWDPVDLDKVKERFPDPGDRTRYNRTLSMYFTLLKEAGFFPPKEFKIALNFNQGIRRKLIEEYPDLRETVSIEMKDRKEEVGDEQDVKVAIRVYEKISALYETDFEKKTFKDSERSGQPYFDQLQLMLLRMLTDKNISGPRKITPFNIYHDPEGSNILGEITGDVNSGKTAIIDLSNADENVARQYSDLICRSILKSQMNKFASNSMGDHSVLFYFEEAHNLFRQDDKDLTSIYNKLAKEGAKFRIGMVYATQSMTTLSPDLMKNTENFFIAHLNDDREIKELMHKYEFRDLALDIQRCKSKGYVRMITLSQRFALPVQINKFELRISRQPVTFDGERQAVLF